MSLIKKPSIKSLQAENRALKAGLLQALEALNHYGPAPLHEGSCGPESGCDGACMDASYFWEQMRPLWKLVGV